MAKHHQNRPHNELMENREEFRIIWLDATINDSDDSVKTQKMLLKLNPAAEFYTDPVQCVDVIKSIRDEQILLIISGSFARNVLPQTHQLLSVVAIFIFCAVSKDHASLMNDYKKIVNIFINQDDLLESLRQTLNLLEKQRFTFNLFDQKENSTRDLSKESASFLWHQLIVYVLEQMKQNNQSKEDLLKKCEDFYRFDPDELEKIARFRKDYSPAQSIEWYTEEGFLYKLLNKALRREDIELIYSFRFVIIDLCSEIKQEYLQLKNNGVFTTYRGQMISSEELEKWKKNEKKMISINSFFSTSLDINVSLNFARRGEISAGIERILFEIEVDPSLKTVVCADISHRGRHKEEKEILFNLNSLFKIISVGFDSIYRLYKIHLKTTDEGVEDIEKHLEYIQQEIDACSPMICFGSLLLNELNQVDQAEKYFQMLLKTLPSNHPDIAAVYNGIGRVYAKRNNLNSALKNYEIALKIRQERLPPNHSLIAASLHNVANIEREKGNLDRALDYFQKALQIEENKHPEDHLQKATIILNIGNAYTEKNELDTALEQLFRALDMFRNLLPEKHPTISTCLSDIGLVYEKTDHFKEALDYYHEAYEMDKCCLSSDHPYLLKDLKNLVFTYKKNGELNKALDLCRNKLDGLKNMPENNHTYIAKILIIMAEVLKDKNPMEASIAYCQEALENLQKSIPNDQLAIAKCLDCLGGIYATHQQFEHALSNLSQALLLYREYLPVNHIDIAKICRIIALCYQKTNAQEKAVFYFKQSRSIYQDNYGSNHEDVKSLEEDIAKLNGEQQITASSIELAEKNVTDEQLITTASIESTEEHVSDEQHITVIIDSDICLPVVASTPLPVIDSTSTQQSDPAKTGSKTKTPTKRKRCPKCEIL